MNTENLVDILLVLGVLIGIAYAAIEVKRNNSPKSN
jgi:hypothetical protein